TRTQCSRIHLRMALTSAQDRGRSDSLPRRHTKSSAAFAFLERLCRTASRLAGDTLQAAACLTLSSYFGSPDPDSHVSPEKQRSPVERLAEKPAENAKADAERVSRRLARSCLVDLLEMDRLSPIPCTVVFIRTRGANFSRKGRDQRISIQ